MKSCRANHFRPWIGAAVSALLGTLPLLSGSAIAQATIYVPNRDLTPYEIVAEDGVSCIEASAMPNASEGFAVSLQACNHNNRMQKFYFLRTLDQVIDFVPQTDGPNGLKSPSNYNARVVIAAEMDKSQGAGFSFLNLAADGTGTLKGAPTSRPPSGSPPSTPSGAWWWVLPKPVDPAIVSYDHTPLRMVIQQYYNGQTQCLGRNGSSGNTLMIPCVSPPTSTQPSWTMRPTTYPQ